MASRLRICSSAVVITAVLSACSAHQNPSEQRLRTAWIGVQEQLDRLAKFEFDFRAAAAAAARKTEAEKLQFVRDALVQRSQLMTGLQRELRGFAAAAASEPKAVRIANIKKYQREMDKLAAIQKGTIPSLKALALEKFEDQLRGYQAHLDAELRRTK